MLNNFQTKKTIISVNTDWCRQCLTLKYNNNGKGGKYVWQIRKVAYKTGNVLFVTEPV